MNADEWAVREPHPALRYLVTRYTGYTRHGVAPGVHRGLPGPHVTLVISLARPIRIVRMPRPGAAATALQALAGGLHTGPVLIGQDEFQSGIQLDLNPLGTRALLGLPAAELSGHVTDLANLGSPALAALPERLAAASDWPRRFALLDETLRAAGAGARASVAPEVEYAWDRLLAAGGRLRVETLAGELGWSRRHLGERFRRELGVSPKQAARVLRFERTARSLRRRAEVDLAGLALDCGYYDQAHLTNEWRALAGCPPGRWIAEELRSLPPGESRSG
ncbi:AraC family transcriptional regulator [Qaidamihabitans albus]|uniref:AraC family transcriptional regulator n=1 Tax=Qaidamihabitans albus TaxID=2795733 RepID=UPI0018F1B1B4|nr:helix-turn-helix domain-containing protein [Qaidamihabitans albus]